MSFLQNKTYKKCTLFFFFRVLQLITGLLLIYNFYTSWSTWFISLKLCVGFSIFDSVSFTLNFKFLLNKKRPFKIKIIEELHTVLLPDLSFLSCNNKFESSMVPAWVGAPRKITWRSTFKMYTMENLSTFSIQSNLSIANTYGF